MKTELFSLKLMAKIAGFMIILLIYPGCIEDETATGNLGKLELNPGEMIVNTSTIIKLRIQAQPGIKISSENLKVIKIGKDGKESEIGAVADNGNLLEYGDDIKGDNIFNGKVTVTESVSGDIFLKVKGEMFNDKGNPVAVQSEKTVLKVYEDIKPSEIKSLFTVQNDIKNQLKTFLGNNQSNAPQAIGNLLEWIKARPEVESASLSNGSSIEIKYKSGLMGGVVISLEDANGKVDTRGGLSVPQPGEPKERGKTAKIPVSKQTRGENYYAGSEINYRDDFDPDLIGNRNVFIYAPYEASWANNERPHIINILDTLKCGDFDVTYYTNQDANVARLAEMMSYGMVVLSTHGSGGGKALLTGEIADTLLPEYQTYKALMKGDEPKMGISKNITISKQGAVIDKKDVYKLYASYISSLTGIFPQSVILANFCGSDQTPPLRDAFLGKGAKTYFGYTESVNGGFCVAVSKDVFLTLASKKKTTADVSKINTSDPQPPNATFKIQGSGTMRYPSEIVNGNFEKGMLGWTKSGDGRVISQLGSEDTGEGLYMGIISTGLGYTTATGSIFQSFTVPNNANTLELKWNFLSEEFLEYIGSSYQDKFSIVLQSEYFGEEILLSRTIDGIAASFGAKAPTDEIPEGVPGDLIAVSPDIVFDQGNVYMTGWQSESFDIKSYRGKCVTLIFRSTDVGDSIYDTAILIDDVKFK
jgi:hypothetical protein